MSKPLPIVKCGHPVLRTRAREVPAEELRTEEFRKLVRKMVDAMRAAPGVGLAAPQIGVDQRVIVLEDAERLMSKLSPAERAARGRVPVPLTCIVNPVLTLVRTEPVTFFEGCLSVPGFMALVERAVEVRVTGTNEKGEPIDWTVSGWPARILQHECDHLEGTLYVDRMLTRTFGANDEVLARWAAMDPADVRARLARPGAEGA